MIMKKLILLLLFIPLVSFGQDDEKKGLNNILEQVKKLAKEYVKDGDIKMIKVDTVAYEYDIKKIGNFNKDIERFKLYETQNVNMFLKLDTSTGIINMVQYGMGDIEAVDIPLNYLGIADEKETLKFIYEGDINFYIEIKDSDEYTDEQKADWKPLNSFKEFLKTKKVAQIGRFKLYPTQNIYNFIMVDVIDGDTYQVQWSFDSENRFVTPISK